MAAPRDLGPLKIGSRVVNADGVELVVRAIYQSARGRVTEVALRSDSGAIDFIALLPKVEKWERVK